MDAPVLPPAAQAWKEANAKLRAAEIPYRLRAISRSPFIAIRHLGADGKAQRQFSLQPLLVASTEDIEEALARCLEAHQLGQWPDPGAKGVQQPTFAQVVERSLPHLKAQPQGGHGQRVEAELRQLGEQVGHVTIERLRRWALGATTQGPYSQRLDALAVMDRALKAEADGPPPLDLHPLLLELQAQGPQPIPAASGQDATRQMRPSPTGRVTRASSGPLRPLPAKVWTEANARLRALHVSYRLRATPGSPFILIRQLGADRKVVRQFSLKPLLAASMEDIEEALARCLDAERLGQWPGDDPASANAPRLTFSELAALTLHHIQARLKASSSAHMRGHLKQLSAIPGHVTIDRLRDWVLEVSPSALSVYEKRLGTLAAMDQALQAGPERQQGLDLQPLVVELRARKPKGGELKRIKDARRKPKAIPSDEALEAWLDGLDDPLLQWVYGLIATYGLRPSEVWHVLPIDSHGWITVPGDQLTKTATHVAPALPMAWVERYGLRDRFGEMQERLLQRWQIQWTDLGGQRVPNNNTSLSNYLYKQFQLRGTPKLWARAWEGDGQDWCRPYDLRHAYAVRCWSHPEASAIPMAEHAEWMGHGLELHRSTYLRWMSPEARAAAARARAGHGQPAAAPALPDGITPELLALGRQLKALQG